MRSRVKATASSGRASTAASTRSAVFMRGAGVSYSMPRVAYLLVIVCYSLAQIALGVWIARRVRRTSDFFVAGRALGPGMLAATLLAANIGGGSTVGAAGLGFRDGFAAWWGVGSAAVGLAIFAVPVRRRPCPLVPGPPLQAAG